MVRKRSKSSRESLLALEGNFSLLNVRKEESVRAINRFFLFCNSNSDLKQYISDDVNYVITDKKWSKEFEEVIFAK